MAIAIGEKFSIRPSEVLDNWAYDEFLVTFAKITNDRLATETGGRPYIRFMNRYAFNSALEEAKILEEDENRSEFIKSIENGS